MEQLQAGVVQFADQWENYYLPDKAAKCKPQVDIFLAQIDSLLESMNEGSKKQKAKLFYLKGRVMDVLPSYQKSAEQLLNKSIKLNPANGDCWNTLAHVLFKRKDIEGAQKAIEMALQCKGKNKVSLRYQSVLLRTQGKTDEERRKNKEESLKISKQALMLDMKDGCTWYFLGNAYFSNFVANFKKFDQLQHALKAYHEAEKYLLHPFPDLHLNRANVEQHMEEYTSAVRDYLAADSIDQSLGANQQIGVIKQRLQFTKTCFDRATEIKKPKLEQLLKNIPNQITKPKQSLQVVGIKALKERYNQKKILTGKIINKITSKGDIPSSFFALDGQGCFFTLSMYNCSQSIDAKLVRDAVVYIEQPQLKIVQGNLSQNAAQKWQYPSIQVFQIVKVTVNKTRLTKQQFNPHEVVNQTFEK